MYIVDRNNKQRGNKMADKYQEIEPKCGIKVTNVRVFPFKETSTRIYTKGMATITLIDAIVIRGLRIMSGPNGMFVAYPIDPVVKGEDARSVVAPSRDDLRSYIEAVVLNKFNAVMEYWLYFVAVFATTIFR